MIDPDHRRIPPRMGMAGVFLGWTALAVRVKTLRDLWLDILWRFTIDLLAVVDPEVIHPRCQLYHSYQVRNGTAAPEGRI